jgi:hypothetical protein
MGKDAEGDGTLEAPKLVLDRHVKRIAQIYTGTKQRRYHNTFPTNIQQHQELHEVGIQRT